MLILHMRSGQADDPSHLLRTGRRLIQLSVDEIHSVVGRPSSVVVVWI